MRIRILYDNKPTYLEVPDKDCTVMIDSDYEERLSSAEDKEAVARRSVQEIMEERFNKPEYNNWHKFNRHYGEPKKKFRKDDEAEDKSDVMDSFSDNLELLIFYLFYFGQNKEEIVKCVIGVWKYGVITPVLRALK